MVRPAQAVIANNIRNKHEEVIPRGKAFSTGTEQYIGFSVFPPQPGDQNGDSIYYYRINGPNGLTAMYIDTVSGNSGFYYIFKDYLGSYDKITDATGNIVESYSFDAWGRRRNTDDWSYDNLPSSYIFDRGYTGHEHLDEFDLIHMNGRLYDPMLCQFLSPDNFVQNAQATQNYNRYSYCLNNPMKYTDPSGWEHGPVAYSEGRGYAFYNLGDYMVYLHNGGDFRREYLWNPAYNPYSAYVNPFSTKFHASMAANGIYTPENSGYFADVQYEKLMIESGFSKKTQSVYNRPTGTNVNVVQLLFGPNGVFTAWEDGNAGYSSAVTYDGSNGYVVGDSYAFAPIRYNIAYSAQSQGGNPTNAWINDVEVGTKTRFTMVTNTSLEHMTADQARNFLNTQESIFEKRATYFSRTSYAACLLAAKAHWGVGATIATVGFVGGEVFGDIANRYDNVEALIGSVHTDGVYMKTIDRTTFSIRSTVSSKSIQIYTYDGQIIGELGY